MDKYLGSDGPGGMGESSTAFGRNKHRQLQFSGTGGQYFGIWIVNLLLTILTAGIWSAWAKVRRLRFFLGNTRLDSDGFEYHARPVTILKGRLIAVAVIIGYYLVSYADKNLQIILPFAFLPVYPWLLNRSFRFNARMTSWRNVRFDWTGTYWGATKGLLLWPLVGLLSVGILAPVASRNIREFIARNYFFGTARFSARMGLAPFYTAFGIAILVFAGITAPLVVGAVVLFKAAQVGDLQSAGGTAFNPMTLIPLLGVFGIIIAGQFYSVMARNIMVRALKLAGGHKFDSNLSPWGFLWIRLSNMLAVILSLGLLLPWSQVRAWRYQCDSLSVMPNGSLDGFIDSQHASGGAFGEELAGLQDIDIPI